MESYNLTETQIRFFKTFGYLGFPGLFEPAEVAWITDGFEEAINRVGKGQEHDGSNRTMFGAPIEHSAKMCSLLDDPRILGILGGLIGDDFNYCSGDGNYYSGDTGWHPDGNWGELFAVKVAFYLDPLTRDTGCLRVIPGSQDPDHYVRKHKINMNGSQELFGTEPREFPGNVALETNPGDMLIFNHDTYHAAFGGSNRRRMFTMNCIRNCKTEHELDLCYQYLRVHSPGGYNVHTGGGMFYPTMLDTADENRMEHLIQPTHIHNVLFPHLARHQAKPAD